MAEAALLGVANSVLQQLGSPASKEFLLVWDFDKDLKNLKLTIQTITAFLIDAEQRGSNDELVRIWLSRLRAALYEADDLFDALAARALRKKVMSGNSFRKEEESLIHDIPWHLFPSVRALNLKWIRNFRSIPDGIQHLISLQALTIDRCKGLQEIPNWIINLAHLPQIAPY